ncbi:MAG: putative DNA binding domain-containing protein [Acidobacteria bacterium]|nr:putative DNA binding domain-containing protein [Acidobacteriota bacterium]
MPISVLELTDKQLQEVLSYTEGHFLDVKSKEIRPSKLTRTISAFANADGGEVYVGISESVSLPFPHKWDGFADPEDANAHLQVFEALFPLGEDYLYNFLSHPRQTGVILQVIVRKTRSIVAANDRTPYIRRGAQNLPVDTPAKLAILERNKGITSFENEPVSTDLANIYNSATTIKFILDVIPTSEPELWLKKQELVRNERPTVAGVVLFADLPQAILPKRCGIKIYRYKTGEADGNRDTLVGDPLTIEGCTYDLIKEAVRTTREVISRIQVLGTRGLEPVNYPTETLHEVITNAVLHRDYSVADDVHVRIFDNRVEVESPGRLPGHITPKNILAERFARNGSMVRIVNKFPDPPNKDVGEGLNTAFEAMRNLRLKDPVVLERDNSVVVQIKHEKLASAEDLIMEYLDNPDNTLITNRIARGLTGIKSENSMKSVFLRLRDRELIEPVPGRSGFSSAWQMKRGNGH